jgi:uncharacterized protein YjbJ (UPF0337 family)
VVPKRCPGARRVVSDPAFPRSFRGSEKLLRVAQLLGVIDASKSPHDFIRKWSDEDMNKDRIVGMAKEAKGAIKETTGKVVGDAKLTAEGRVDKAEGKVQNAVGGLKDALKK